MPDGATALNRIWLKACFIEPERPPEDELWCVLRSSLAGRFRLLKSIRLLFVGAHADCAHPISHEQDTTLTSFYTRLWGS